MRLLVLADQVPFLPVPALLATQRPDVVVTLGDLEPDVLDPVGRFDIPVLGVYGNHDDGGYLGASNSVDLHMSSATIGGVTFAGFEGCVCYRPGAPLQYTQSEASRLIRDLPRADVLVSHAPPRGVHEEPDDLAHEGFEALREYIDKVQPRLSLHGHTPAPARGPARIGETTVVHVVGHRVLEI